MKKNKELVKLEAEITVLEKVIEYHKDMSKSGNQELETASKAFLRADAWEMRKCQLALLALTK